MPRMRNARMLLSAPSSSLRFFSSRRSLSWHALARRVGEHQPAAVQHADEVLQLLDADRLRRELGFEPLGDLVEARLAVEHLQDGELFFLEAEVLQADRVLHHPVGAALVALPARLRDPAARGSSASATSWRRCCRRGWAWGRGRGRGSGFRRGNDGPPTARWRRLGVSKAQLGTRLFDGNLLLQRSIISTLETVSMRMHQALQIRHDARSPLGDKVGCGDHENSPRRRR